MSNFTGLSVSLCFISVLPDVSVHASFWWVCMWHGCRRDAASPAGDLGPPAPAGGAGRHSPGQGGPRHGHLRGRTRLCVWGVLHERQAYQRHLAVRQLYRQVDATDTSVRRRAGWKVMNGYDDHHLFSHWCYEAHKYITSFILFYILTVELFVTKMAEVL